VRLRHICTIATSILLFGGLASTAEGKTKGSGGAIAPGSTGGTGVTTTTTGSTGETGTTGTTGTTGAPNPTAPLADLAPIVLGRSQSDSVDYSGPVFELTAAGLVPYTIPSSSASTAPTTVAGGTTGPTAVAGGTTAAATTSSDIRPLSTDLPELEVPGSTAVEIKIDGLGLAAAPEDAPVQVQEVIWAANRLIGLPYLWGGGHQSFYSPRGYDCSGTVSFALHGGDLLSSPLDSGQFMSWGQRGQGTWMTILTNSGHAYLDVAGLRLDTSSADDPSNLQGPRWRPLRLDNHGYVKRHPVGY